MDNAEGTGNINRAKSHNAGVSKKHLSNQSRYPPSISNTMCEDSEDDDLLIVNSMSEDDETDVDMPGLMPSSMSPGVAPTKTPTHTCTHTHNPQNFQPTNPTRVQSQSRSNTLNQQRGMDEMDRVCYEEQKEDEWKLQNEKRLKQLRSQLTRKQNDILQSKIQTGTMLHNNMLFHKQGIEREFVSSSATEPPGWDIKRSISVITDRSTETQDEEYEAIEMEDDSGYVFAPEYGAMSNTQSNVVLAGENSVFMMHSKTISYEERLEPKVVYREASETEPEIIPTTRDKWWITVPVRGDDGKVTYYKMLADAGANIPCVNSKWALKYFRKYICHNNTHSRILTAGGDVIRPKYLLWMTFPTNDGKILKAKFYLVDDLPVDILADINMLKAFGYRFKDEIPPRFAHNAEYASKLGLKEHDMMHKINKMDMAQIKHVIDKYRESKLAHMHQNEGYNRALHTHFIQMAACLSTLVKDGENQTEALFNDQHNHRVTMGILEDTANQGCTKHTWDHSDSVDPDSSPEYQVNTVQNSPSMSMPDLTPELKCYDNLYTGETVSKPVIASNSEDDETPMINDESDEECDDLMKLINDTDANIMAQRANNTQFSEIEAQGANNTQLNDAMSETPQTIDYQTDSSVSYGLASEASVSLGSTVHSVGITPEVYESSSESIAYSMDAPVDTPDSQILTLPNSTQTSLSPSIQSLNDIEIPGVDPINRQQGALLAEMQALQPRTHGSYIQPLCSTSRTSDQSHKLFTTTNSHAWRSKPTGTRVHKINMRIGHTSVKLGNTINKHNTHHVNYAVAHHQFQATEEEITKARLLKLNEELKWNNIGYIKDLEKKFPKKYKGLHRGTVKLIKEYKDVFAKLLFERRTLRNIQPARLGVRPEHRDDICFVKQYNIPPLQRLHMIKYTEANDENQFWDKITGSLNCIPYTMVPKKNEKREIVRWRPAFDARGVNKWCNLIPCWMPTMRDFDEFFALKGLITIADCKNFFDCIPLAKEDQKWATVLTPLGLRRMKHLTYGWKNAAPIAQNIMNKLCLVVGWMLGYIDDIAIKHPWHFTTKKLLQHLRKFLEACRKLGVLLHPGKFWPFATSIISLGLKRDMMGSEMTEVYRQKILSLPKPQTAGELRSAEGVIGYVGRYIKNYAFHKYWLQQLVNGLKKKQKVKWTQQADYAWDKIMENVKNAKILYNPTRNGLFCIKTDASKYGIGAVLYQRQYDEKTHKWVWRIIDMYSAIIKQDLRKAHSMVHEALAIVKACEYWQFHLYKQRFLISCDNRPVVYIFDEKHLFDHNTRHQLGRLRTQLRGYSFDIAHVAGIDNELADGLSRFTVNFEENNKLIAQPIISTDTGNKPLTDEEKEKFEKSLMYLKSYDINHTTLLIDDLADKLGRDFKYSTIKKSHKTQYNKICGDFKAHANYAQKKRVKQFINQNGNNLITSDEYQFNTQPCVNLITGLQPVLKDIVHMSDASLDYFKSQFKDTDSIYDQNNTLDELTYSMVDDDESDCIEYDSEETVHTTPITPDATMCEEYNLNIIQQTINEGKPIQISDLKLLSQIRTHLTFDSEHSCYTAETSTTNTHKMQTRAKAHAKQYNVRPKQYRVDYVNPEGDAVAHRLQTQKEFIHDLVGYRSKCDFFDPKVFLRYQQTDRSLQTLRYCIKSGIFMDKFLEQDVQNDIDYIREYHFKLYDAWITHQLGIHKTRRTLVIKQNQRWVDIVPECLVGRIMDYGHHNLSMNHLGYQPTLDSIESQYWWDTMRSDIKQHIQECRLCQYVKHGKPLRAPMRIRELPKPREHIMADFLDCVHAKYHILVIIDYGSNYAMLIPCESCDTRAVVNGILSHWIPIFGLFKSFETDFGSGFNNNILKLLTRVLGIKHTFAEARNHRGIGKVERLIGYIQTIFNLYNVQSNNQLIPNDTEDNYVSHDDVWERVKALLPFVQQSINRRKPRFTQYSPNMLMFGTELRDYGNIKEMINELNTEYKKDNKSINTKDYTYLSELLQKLDTIQQSYKDDWEKYTHYSAQQYNEKFKIKIIKDKKKILDTFHVNDKVLYYVGDRQVASRKWRQRWSGPWYIKSVDAETCAIEIEDRDTANSKFVSVDRIKLWNNGKDTIPQLDNDEYEYNQDRLQSQFEKRYKL